MTEKRVEKHFGKNVVATDDESYLKLMPGLE